MGVKIRVVSPIPPHSGSVDGSPGNLLPGPHTTRGIGTAGGVSPGVLDPLPSMEH